MSWLGKLLPSRIRTEAGTRRKVPEGLWSKCENCSAVLYRAELERNLEVCPKCSFHMRQGARERLDQFLDPEPREEIGADLHPVDVLKFKDSKKYKDRLSQAQKATGERDALIVMKGCLAGMPIVASAFEFRFIGGSMGAVVGERFVRGVSAALEARCPVVSFSASGGARMQEALVLAVSDGKDERRDRPSGRIRVTVYFGAHGPDHRRCLGESCDAGRCQYRGAGSADRLCRPEGDRANGARDPARGVPTQ